MTDEQSSETSAEGLPQSPVAPPVGKYSTKLVIGVTLGILALVLIPFASLISLLLGIVAVVLGHVGLSEIRTTGEGSRNLGLTALGLGYGSLGIILIALLVGSAAVGAANSNLHRNGNVSCNWPTPPTEKQEQRCINSYGS